MEIKKELATFGAGCFWGVEELYRELSGVLETAVGYMGGDMEKLSYQDVCTDETGHVEVVQVTYDPTKTTYDKLLEIFWENHDPTTPNRQGPDVGSQYRSVIFYHTSEQQKLAEKLKTDLEILKKFDRPIVTQIVPAQTFWKAEEYHQQYLKKRGLNVCH